jgi:hypothetical protein
VGEGRGGEEGGRGGRWKVDEIDGTAGTERNGRNRTNGRKWKDMGGTEGAEVTVEMERTEGTGRHEMKGTKRNGWQ